MTPEEHDHHDKGITGSKIACLIPGSDGQPLSPWGSPFSVWASMLPDYERRPSTTDQRFGHVVERSLMQWGIEQIDGMVLHPGQMIVHPDHDWCRGNTDGYAELPSETWVGLDAKTCDTFDDRWGPDGSDRIPHHLALQMQWYMGIEGAPVWYVPAMALGFSRELRLFVIEADPGVFEHLLNVAGEFWHRHVVKDIPPPFDVAAARVYLRKRHATHSETVREATKGAECARIDEWYDAKAREKAAKADLKRLGVDLMDAIGDDLGIEHPDGRRIKWSRWTQGVTDWKAVKAARPDIAGDIAEHTTESRRGRLNPSKRTK